MAAFDFPSSPSVNQTYTANGVTWKWNGTMWMRVSGAGYLEKIEEGNSKVEVDDSGSGNITATTDGTERLRITSAGAVGINTTTPVAPLEIQGVGGVNDSRITFTRHGTPANNSVIGELFYRIGTDSVAGIGAYRESAMDDAYLAFFTQPTGGSYGERLRINSAGEVYIGSSAVNGQGKLFVNDSSGTTTTRVHIRNAVSTGNAETYYNLDGTKFASVGLENGSLVFRNSTSSTPTERLRIDSSGNLTAVNTSSGGAVTLKVGANAVSGVNNGTIIINNGGTGDGALQFDYENSAARAKIYVYRSTQDLIFDTAGSERLRIDSSGNAILKTANGAFKSENPNSSGDYVRMYAGAGTAQWDIYGNGELLRMSENSGNSAARVQFDLPTTHRSTSTTTGVAALTAQQEVNNGGYLIFDGKNSSGTSVFNVTHNGRVKVSDGIDFSATSDASGMTSELLDDYEEGTWTPTIRLDGGTANGTTLTPESNSYKGRYVKIGDMVFVEAYVRYNLSTLSGTWSTTAIQGLPYTQGNQSNQQYTGVHIGYLSGFYSGFPTTGNAFPAGYVRSGQSDLILTINDPNSSETTVSNSVLSSSASGGIMFSAYYRDSASG